MANFNLNETGGTDILTSFRYKVEIIESLAASTGVNEKVVGYSQSCGLPSADGSPIPWNLPGGMINYQAGKRTVKPISLSFVVNTEAGNHSIYSILEKWSHATYDLETGANKGKRNYCTDSIKIQLMGEDLRVKYTFQLLRAQVTSVDYGSVGGESNSLLAINCNVIYDNYKVFKGDTQTQLRTLV